MCAAAHAALLPPPLPPLLLLLPPPLLLIESFHVQGVAQDSNDDSDLMPTGARLPSRRPCAACPRRRCFAPHPQHSLNFWRFFCRTRPHFSGRKRRLQLLLCNVTN
jgi:hypothetical protein